MTIVLRVVADIVRLANTVYGQVSAVYLWNDSYDAGWLQI